MKKWIAAAMLAAMLICALAPGVSYTEDRDTVLLARAIYALGRGEAYEAKLALGCVALNRVDDPWFAPTLRGVLTEQHQFPIGTRYDDESLSAAHELLAGRRVLSPDALYYQSLAASEPWSAEPLAVVGGYAFYAEPG